MTVQTLTISVLVPTFRRPDDLRRCLAALAAQTRPADQIIVTVRTEDEETAGLLETLDVEALRLRTVAVAVPGQVAALNAGLENAAGDIVAITDDDAAPRPEWLARIEAHFQADPLLGGVGGRDWLYQGGDLVEGSCRVVGRVQWFGRVIGNHHLLTHGAREVELLKGANMSYRRAALNGLRFDTRLRGTGAQVHNDLAFSLAVKKSGWRLLYDPAVEIDHYTGPRYDEDQRNAFNTVALRSAAYNDTLTLLDYLPAPRRVAYLLWALLVGTRWSPGVLAALRLAARRDRHAFRRLRASLAGRWDCLRGQNRKNN